LKKKNPQEGIIDMTQQPRPERKIGAVIRWQSKIKPDANWFGEIMEIKITKDKVVYTLQDGEEVDESQVRAEYSEIPF
jgi:hypothetical protein